MSGPIATYANNGAKLPNPLADNALGPLARATAGRLARAPDTDWAAIILEAFGVAEEIRRGQQLRHRQQDETDHPGGHPAYHKLLRRMSALHAEKSSDYGDDEDPLANYRGSDDVGVEPWRACLVRARDKWQRIVNYCKRGRLTNESFDDALIDMAAHGLMAMILHGEARDAETVKVA